MMANNVNEMTDVDVLEIAINACNANGYELLAIRELPHPDEHFLRFVVAHNERTKQYVTWMLNLEFGGLNGGNYFGYGGYTDGYSDASKAEAFKMVFEDFKNRR